MVGFIESPNKWRGRKGYKPEIIVIHMTAGSYKSAHDWLLNPKSEVSSHYLVNRLGQYDQLVKFEDSAWHAGIVKNPSFKLFKPGVNPNLYTLGIEIALKEGEQMTAKQVRAVVGILQHLSEMFKIPLDCDHVIPHHAIRSDKTCPGPYVNVQALIWLAQLAEV